MLAVHFENLLFLLVLVVAGLFQLLGRAARNTSKDEAEQTSSQPPPRTLKPIPRASKESDQERIRKFLEALGQPPASHPPPPALPRTNIPPRPLAPVQPPLPQIWKVTRQERRKRQVILGPPAETPKTAEKTLPPVPAPAFETEPLQIQPSLIKTPVETYAAATRPGSKEGFNADIATLLASKATLREAIILREILGPPRALRASELL